jgi:hypothetical protein
MPRSEGFLGVRLDMVLQRCGSAQDYRARIRASMGKGKKDGGGVGFEGEASQRGVG